MAFQTHGDVSDAQITRLEVILVEHRPHMTTALRRALSKRIEDLALLVLIEEHQSQFIVVTPEQAEAFAKHFAASPGNIMMATAAVELRLLFSVAPVVGFERCLVIDGITSHVARLRFSTDVRQTVQEYS